MNKTYLQEIEQHGSENGWVAPLTADDRNYLVHFRAVCKRYMPTALNAAMLYRKQLTTRNSADSTPTMASLQS